MRKILGLCLAFVLFTLTALAQKTVTGTVTDEKGNPLPNVSVQVKGTKIGTVTDASGSYSINVPANGKTLVFSSAELGTEEVAISNKTSINQILRASDKNLQEVVVVGYGATQRRGDVSAAIGKINAGPISTLVTPSVDKQLGGRTAGVQVTNPSGLVNQPPRVRVRGINSISGSREPLYVLDGVPMPSGGYSGVTNDNLLADINPNDIESIEVLKDGAAAAIYGSRASNGVILITTKRGRSGAPRVNYSATFGYSKPSKKFDLLTGDDFVTIANEKLTAAPGGTAQAFNPNHINTDWQSLVFRDVAKSQIHNLSIEGSNERSSYFLSFNYADLQGLVVTNATKRYAVRANIDQRINKWLKISNNITLSRSEDADQNNGGNSLSGAIYNAIRALPNVSPYDTANTKYGGYNITSDGKALGQGDNTRLIDNNNTNIAYVLTHNKFMSTKHRIIDNLSVDIKPLNWLTYTSRFNIDYITLNDFQSLDPLHGDGQSNNGLIFNQSANTLRWVLQNYINANKSFGNHNIAFTVASELQDQKSNSFYAQGTGVDPFFLQKNIISNSLTTQYSGGGYGDGPSFLSFLGRVNYDYAGKYFIGASFRRDGLSRFAEDKRWGNFPGVSASYKISKENFWQSSPLSTVFNDFKIRGSWAKVGNTNIAGGNFAYLNLYGLAPYGSIAGISASQVGNSNLTWETSKKTDVGVDFALFDSRITSTVDYFNNTIDNTLVFSAPLPPSVGVPGNSILRNVGGLVNKGWEFSINASIIRKADLQWDLSLNYTTQDNKVTSLYQGNDVPVTGGSGATYGILRVGQPLNVLYGYQYAGVNAANGNPMYYKANGTLIQGNVTDTKYYTVNADGSVGTQTTLSGSDQIILGNTLVKWFGGINSTLKYKAFQLDMLWRYAGGNKIMNITRQESLLNQGFTNSGTELLGRWTKAGQVTDVPRLWYGRDNFINLTNNSVSRFVEPGDFIRLDNLQLTYSVPSSILSRVTKDNVKSFRFFVQGQNLLLITKYKGLDPENIGEQGLDYNTVPSARTISFGLNVGF